jgi:hypothetical protein
MFSMLLVHYFSYIIPPGAGSTWKHLIFGFDCDLVNAGDDLVQNMTLF